MRFNLLAVVLGLLLVAAGPAVTMGHPGAFGMSAENHSVETERPVENVTQRMIISLEDNSVNARFQVFHRISCSVLE